MKNNINELISVGSKYLKDKHIQSYKLDTELLLCKVLNHTRSSLLLNESKNLDKLSINKFHKLYFT